MTAPSNANTSVLEACPFCGGEAWLNAYEAKYSDLPPKSRAPQCRSCGASLGYLTTPAKATEAWNRRVTAASAQAEITSLTEAVRRAEINEAIWSDLADAHKARADRLAKALETLLSYDEQDAGCIPTDAHLDAQNDARAALQQEG